MTDFNTLLGALTSQQVVFIIVGGAAAIAHGSARLTLNLEIVYERSTANLDRLVAALSPLKPYLRGAPAALPFVLDRATLRRGLNLPSPLRLAISIYLEKSSVAAPTNNCSGMPWRSSCLA